MVAPPPHQDPTPVHRYAAKISALTAAGIGVALFHVLNIPLPWLLGSMFGCLAAALMGIRLAGAPQVSIPVHGEARHLAEHAELARACQVPQAVVAENGTLISLSAEGAEVLGHVPSGRLLLDGNRLIPADSPVVRGRQKLVYNGVALLSLVVDETGALASEPCLSLQGVLDPDEEADARAGRNSVRPCSTTRSCRSGTMAMSICASGWQCAK